MKLLIFSIKVIFLLAIVVFFSSELIYATNLDLEQIKLNGVEEIYIDTSGAEIEFDQDSNKIYLSKELRVRRIANELNISSPKSESFKFFNRNHYKIIIGTSKRYSIVDINVKGAKIKGVLHADKISLNAAGMDLELDLYAKEVDINGAGIELDGFIEAENLNINGAGMDVFINVKGLENLKLSGVGMFADVKYLDKWKDTRNVSANGVGGKLRLLVPIANKDLEDGGLAVDANGIVAVDINYY